MKTLPQSPRRGKKLFEKLYRQARSVSRSVLKKYPSLRSLYGTTDLLHQAFVHVAQRGYNDSTHFLRSLRSLLHLQANEEVRRQCTRRRKVDLVPLTGAERAFVRDQWTRYDLERTFEGLDPELCALYLSRFVQGLTLAELASKFDTSVATVKRRLRKGEGILKRELSAYDETHEVRPEVTDE